MLYFVDEYVISVGPYSSQSINKLFNLSLNLSKGIDDDIFNSITFILIEPSKFSSHFLPSLNKISSYSKSSHQACRIFLPNCSGMEDILHLSENTLDCVDYRSFLKTILSAQFFIQSSPLSLLISASSHLTSSHHPLVGGLRSIVNGVYQVQGFVSLLGGDEEEDGVKGEYEDLDAFFHILKHTSSSSSSLSTTSSILSLPSTIYGIKRDFKKLRISPLHIPPEGLTMSDKKNNLSNSDKQVTRSGGMGCSSNIMTSDNHDIF